ncbi:methyltransferase domain-containing protein [Amycolatopsis ultiminotia]|uniref:Methyltransferase domain-containing protein n=1 Tax=Amycolatopsis ultiminotia TaxID=543629 RepID=A0ABP6WHC2_9PSEU
MSTNSAETADLLALLDAADALPGAAELRTRTYELLDVRPGSVVVDVGSGSGRAVAELAGRGASAVGVDLDPLMVAAARQRHPGQRFREGNAARLPFGAGALGGYRADKVFHALADPAAALAEARRVLAPGGRIVLLGQDWDTVVIDSGDPALTRTLAQARADTLASPRAARAYRSLLLDAGFTGVSVEVQTAVFTDAALFPMLARTVHAAPATVPPEALDAWLAEQEQRAARDRMFVAVPLFVAAARTPLA